jgi:hypothetical protein
MNRLTAWLDNPIVVKHVRSRLRIQPLAASCVVLLVLCICLMWAAKVLDWFRGGYAFGYLLALQTIVLLVMGSVQVGQAVAGARASGILDFHRVSPLSALSLTLGFFFGAPIREYILFAATLPFSIFCVAMGPPRFGGFLQLMLALVVTAWCFHIVSLLMGLVVKNPKAASQGAVAVVLIGVIAASGLFAAMQSVGALVDSSPAWPLFEFNLPWVLVLLLYEFPVLIFALIASHRKMGSERAHIFSKPDAIAALLTLALLLNGMVWQQGGADHLPLVLAVLYALAGVGILLGATVTPSAGEYARGLRRATRLGRISVGLFDDLALNRATVGLLCGIVLIGTSVARTVLETPSARFERTLDYDLSLPIAVGVLTVAYTVLALQYFTLAFPRRGILYFGLFLFLTWAAPLMAGSIVLSGSTARGFADRPIGQLLMGVSPITGIAWASGFPEDALVAVARAGAISPALVFLFLFNTLVTRARRKIDRQVRGDLAKRASPLDAGDQVGAVTAVTR